MPGSLLNAVKLTDFRHPLAWFTTRRSGALRSIDLTLIVSTLRDQLSAVLANGLAGEPLEHAHQVGAVAAILWQACQEAGLQCTLVGGSAIEIHAPGIYRSDDIDVVIEAPASSGLRERIGQVFGGLGLIRAGRHWRLGDLFVEVPGHEITDPTDIVRVGSGVFRIVRKEVLLADRVVGFKHWRYTGYGQQAIDMIAAFGDDLEMGWLEERLVREGSWDAFEALQDLAGSDASVTVDSLTALLERLHN